MECNQEKYTSDVTSHKLNLMFGCVRSVSLGLDTSIGLLLGVGNQRLLWLFWSEEGEFGGGKGNFYL